MGEAIGQILPLAVVAALSPIPIIGVVLMLGSDRARVNGPAFLVGWTAGLAAVGTIVLLLSPPAAGDGEEPATWVSVLKLALGLALVLQSLKHWHGRPVDGEAVSGPKRLGEIAGFTPAKAAAAGAAFSAVNPKNLVIAIAAAVSIAQAGLPGGEEAIAYAVFAAVSTVGVAVPVVLYFALGDRAPALLDRLKAWMARNNAVIMAVLLLVIGVKLIGDAIAGLSG